MEESVFIIKLRRKTAKNSPILNLTFSLYSDIAQLHMKGTAEMFNVTECTRNIRHVPHIGAGASSSFSVPLSSSFFCFNHIFLNNINIPHQTDTDDEIADVDASDDEAENNGQNAVEALRAQVNAEGEDHTSSSRSSGSESRGIGSGSGSESGSGSRSSSSDSESSDGNSVNSI
ncbi:unnamed protein product [Fraxinus pennsylvanica]|uniref:Uncharacterized protein n=1 Tax=Fraxinus pennsylvanica TaxID=56036 RepID=A0AAD1ZBS8_9LAMI|nr:unnamed protein product [Fraxinus pennsylvanica]